MIYFINYLSDNRLTNILLLIIYYVAVVLPHNSVGRMINGLFDTYSRPTYNFIVVIVFSLLLLGILYMSKSEIRKLSNKRCIWLYLIVTLVLLLLCFNVLMVINVEAIHFVQYAILACLLYPLLRNYTDTMTVAVIAGAVDELYQYLFLESNAFYYDFNDVVLDALGAGIGILGLTIFGYRDLTKSTIPWYKRVFFLGPLCIVLCLSLMWFTGSFAINYNYNDSAFFTLFLQPPPAGFWYYPQGPYARFHILTPIPALIIIAGLVIFYGRAGVLHQPNG